MTTNRSRRRRNPYRPGSPSYARFREATLKRRAALASVNAARAKKPEARRRAKQQASTAKRELRIVERREEFRSKLSERDRRVFDRLPIMRQEQFMTIVREYPDSVPMDLPDPFAGPRREPLWRLSYSTRAGIKMRAGMRIVRASPP
jgi:hypothetical protein